MGVSSVAVAVAVDAGVAGVASAVPTAAISGVSPGDPTTVVVTVNVADSPLPSGDGRAHVYTVEPTLTDSVHE